MASPSTAGEMEAMNTISNPDFQLKSASLISASGNHLQRQHHHGHTQGQNFTTHHTHTFTQLVTSRRMYVCIRACNIEPLLTSGRTLPSGRNRILYGAPVHHSCPQARMGDYSTFVLRMHFAINWKGGLFYSPTKAVYWICTKPRPNEPPLDVL